MLGRSSLHVAAVASVLALGGCGLVLDAAPPRDDASQDAAGLDAGRSALDASLDAPGPDATMDAPRPDASAADAPAADALGDDAFRLEDAPSGDAGSDAGSSCACTRRGPCDSPVCVTLPGDVVPSCVHLDTGRCDEGLECRGGLCIEPCGPGCVPGDGCEVASCVDGECVRLRPAPCAAGTVCAAGACVDPARAPCVASDGRLLRGEVCRPRESACDVEDHCDGTSPFCPPDQVERAGTTCRAGHVCDPTEVCDGVSPLCPADLIGLDVDHDRVFPPVDCTGMGGVCNGLGQCLRPGDPCTGAGLPCFDNSGCRVGTLACRSGVPVCERLEVRPPGSICNDPNPARPCEVRVCVTDPAGVCVTQPRRSGICRGSEGACDPAESCNGSTPTCPVDALSPTGTVCRPATGECDRAESCSGTSPSCPSDALLDGGDCGLPGGCAQCNGGVCETPTAPGEVCTDEGGMRGLCTAAGACMVVGSCIVLGAPCAIGELDARTGDCVISGHAAGGTPCRAADGPCVGPAYCPDPLIVARTDFDCPPNPPSPCP